MESHADRRRGRGRGGTFLLGQLDPREADDEVAQVRLLDREGGLDRRHPLQGALALLGPGVVLARDLQLPERGVAAVVRLLAEGATVPFIARYRKEATGGLDEVQIRAIEERRTYVLELEDRRRAVLDTIAAQGLLTDELRAKILACDTKAALEDLYLPFKPKRRTRAMVARERGLQPLADRILAQPDNTDRRLRHPSQDEDEVDPDRTPDPPSRRAQPPERPLVQGCPLGACRRTRHVDSTRSHDTVTGRQPSSTFVPPFPSIA